MSECSESFYAGGVKVRSGQGVVVIDGARMTVVAGKKASEGEIHYRDVPSGTTIHVEAPDGVRLPLEFDPERATGRKGRNSLDLSKVPDEHKARALATALDGLPLDSRESRKYAEKVHDEVREFVKSGYIGHHNMSDIVGTLLTRRSSIKSKSDAESNKHLQNELERIDETIKEMTGLDMTGADLSGSDLSGIKMPGSKMPQSDMSGSDMSGSDMSGSDMSGSNMSGSNMSGSNMSGSNMSGADLSGADLSGADLSGADLSGATGEDTRWDENTKWPEGFDPTRDFKEKSPERDAQGKTSEDKESEKSGASGSGKQDGKQGEKNRASGEQGEQQGEKDGEKSSASGSGKQGEKQDAKQGEKNSASGSGKQGEQQGDKAGEKSSASGSGKQDTRPGGDDKIGYASDRRGRSKTKSEQSHDDTMAQALLTSFANGKGGGGRVQGRESAPEKAMRLAAKRAAERISSMRYRDTDSESGKKSLSVVISPDVSGSTNAWSGTSEAFSSALSSVSGTRVSVTPNVNGAWGYSHIDDAPLDSGGAMARKLTQERSVMIYMGDNHGVDACQELANAGASVIALDAGWQVGMYDGQPTGEVLAERELNMQSSETGQNLTITVRTHAGDHGGKLHWVAGVPMDSPLEWAAAIDAVMKNLEELEAGAGGGEKDVGAILDRGTSEPPSQEVMEVSRDVGEYLVSIGQELSGEPMRFILSPDLSPSTSEWNPIAEAISESLLEIPGASTSVVINSNGAWYADEPGSLDQERSNERISEDIAGGGVLVYLGDDQGYEHCQTVAKTGATVVGVSSDPSPSGDYSEEPIINIEQHGDGRVIWVSNVSTDTPAMVSAGIQEALIALQSEKPTTQIAAPIVEGRVRMASGRKRVEDKVVVSAAKSVQREIAKLPQLQESKRQITSGREWDVEELAKLSAAERDVRPARVPKIKHQRRMVVSFDTSPSTVAWSGSGEAFAREVARSRVLEGTVVQNSNGALMDTRGASAIEQADIVVYLGDEDGLAEFERHVDKEKAIVALCVSDSKVTSGDQVSRRSGGGLIYRATGLPSDQPASWAQALIKATKKIANKW